MKLCQIYNGASAYRESIYLLIDKEFDTDWVFGSSLGDIKLMDVRKLRGNVTLVRNVNLFKGKAYWQTNVVRFIFKKKYTHYLMLGDERCLSTWVFLFLSLFFPKKKIYFWSHGAYGKESRLKNFIQRLFWSFADGAILYGNYAKNVMSCSGFNTKNYYVVHNSLNYTYQLSLRNTDLTSSVFRKHFGNDNPVLIFIGRLTKVKNLDMLVDAISILKNKNEFYNLVLVGEGADENVLKAKVCSLGLESQIWFYGACYDEKINAKLIYNADLCVAPGNVGLTAMHTMVFGTPVISHNNFAWQMPEFEAIHPNETGDFFEYKNTDSLASTISNWFFAHKNDRAEVRNACYHEIDTQWNPNFQIKVIKKLFGQTDK